MQFRNDKCDHSTVGKLEKECFSFTALRLYCVLSLILFLFVYLVFPIFLINVNLQNDSMLIFIFNSICEKVLCNVFGFTTCSGVKKKKILNLNLFGAFCVSSVINVQRFFYF